MREHMMQRPHRRAHRLALLVAIGGLSLAACGSDGATEPASTTVAPADTTGSTADSPPPDTASEETTPADTEPAGTAGESDDTFPLTIDHKYGETEIPARPVRVVSVGYTDIDPILALGVDPVGFREWYGEQPGGVWPWATEALGESEAEVLSAESIEFERIAALKPDIIIGLSSGMTEDEYEQLSAIAPTIAQSGDFVDFGEPWQEITATIGQALGLEDEATELIDGVEAQFVEVRGLIADLGGSTAQFAYIDPDASSYSYATADSRGQFLTNLGFTIEPEVDQLAGELFYAQLSAEQISVLDSDVLFWTTEAGEQDALEANPLFSSLDVVGAGHALFLDPLTAAAMSFGDVLSIPFAIDAILPQLEAAFGAGSGDAASAGGIVTGADPDVDAVVEAYSTVFDATTTVEEKAAFFPEATELADTIAAYTATGEQMGGIQLVPTAVFVTGDTAAVTYDVEFAGTAVYQDLDGTSVKVDGTWTVTKDEFCAFMGQARTPCPA